MRTDHTKQITERLTIKFSQTYSMKSMGSSWENLTLQPWLKGLITKWHGRVG